MNTHRLFGFALQLLLCSFIASDAQAFYASHLGRWLSRDPIGYLSTDLNLYGYVRSNPACLSDPPGLGPTCEETNYRNSRGYVDCWNDCYHDAGVKTYTGEIKTEQEFQDYVERCKSVCKDKYPQTKCPKDNCEMHWLDCVGPALDFSVTSACCTAGTVCAVDCAGLYWSPVLVAQCLKRCAPAKKCCEKIDSSYKQYRDCVLGSVR